MSEPTYFVAQGDLEPDMEIALTVNSEAKNVDTITAMQLRWLKPDGSFSTVDLVAVDLAAGLVKRVWVAGDTALIGKHKGQVVVTWPNAELQSFPSDGTYFEWRVTKPLGS